MSLPEQHLARADAPDDLVSIIIPVYQAEQNLARCLESAFSQTYGNIEVIAVDDGSTDGSSDILAQFEMREPARLRVIRQENAGAAAARNRGVSEARGRWLCFLDDDDWLDPDFVERYVDGARTSGADLVTGGYRRPDAQGRIRLACTPHPNDEWGPYVVEAAWAKLYDKALVEKEGFSFLDTNILEDLHFSLPATQLARKVHVIDYCGYNWFFNEQSVSNTSQRTSDGLRFEETITRLRKMLDERGIGMSPLLCHYFTRLVTWFLLYTRKGDGWRKSRENLARYTGWLDGHVADWRRDAYAAPGHPTGDTRAARTAAWLFARHPRAFKLLLFLYGLLP